MNKRFTEQQINLLSLSNDLKRIVTSIQRESYDNSKRFSMEAKRWLNNCGSINDSYVKDLLKKIDKVLKRKDDLRKAEDCLMYSVLIQNQALHLKK